ncbi:MAG TPA: aldo/keto reductase [Solirubrobacteraceae bacterium]|nr:aldo/keto reductase [Solirubrobacteraceae bacterium]
MDWLAPSELRIGLGCMRLSTDADRDPERAGATIAAAAAAGITVFDTAHAYGRDQSDCGHNERLLATALRGCGAEGTARIVTKGGMTRESGGWVPDGRAKAIRAHCEASLAALDGLPIDTYLLHAPDPRTPWSTSVRALARLHADGLVARIGLSNVNRHQLDEALALAPIGAVQVALSIVDDGALRGGLVERCAERGIALIAHSPLGGPRRTAALARCEELARVAWQHGAEPAEVALAWLLSLSPTVVAIPGARRPETARSAARAAALTLTESDRAALRPDRAALRPDRAALRPDHAARPTGPVPGAEAVMIMGIPGAGKTHAAQEYVARGYERLNRDERGGSLRGIAQALDERLASGTHRVVLDNTYLTRAARSHVIEIAGRRGAAVRCLWVNTPLAQAQVNMVSRLIDLFGAVPSPEELRDLARSTEGVMAPTSQMRALRELEPPAPDEGFSEVQEIPFARVVRDQRGGGGVLVAAPALEQAGWEEAVAGAAPTVPHLIFDWRPGGDPDVLGPSAAALRSVAAGPVEHAICPHEGGPPRCWCRPPLPGLALAFAARHGLALTRSVVIGSGPAHRTLANALGARHVPVVA